MKFQHKLIAIALILPAFVLFAAMIKPTPQQFSDEDVEEMGVWELLSKLGKLDGPHGLNKDMPNVSAKKGAELVHKGITTKPNGKKTKKQSKFYVCTSCHNTVKEFDNLVDISPEKRLEYAEKNNIPFLQASTFHGIVNRTHFYNDDYQEKYGGVEGIKEAHTDLRKAIQFCSMTCSQGRALEDWEVESILAYFWTLELKVKDLNLTDKELQEVKEALAGTGAHKVVHTIDDKFVVAYPAHFTEVPEFELPSETIQNDSKRLASGKAIFEHSCLHCHEKERYSFYSMNSSRLNFRAMESATRKHNHIFSTYILVRDGLPPRRGRKAYMPQFTVEKMSEEQLLNLYLYTRAAAKGKKIE